jgi:hypothetical protein
LSAHSDVFAKASADAEASAKSFSAAFLGIGEIKPLRQAISVGSGRRFAAANRPNQSRLKPRALSARRRRRKGQNGKENQDR